MKIQASFLHLATFFVGYSESASLRNGSIRQSRNLFDATTINSVMSAFVPILNAAIRTSLGALELLNLDDTIGLTEVDFGICTADAALSYSLGAVTGLDTFRIETWELIPGTDLWESSFLGLNGASWNGTWVFRASFDEIRSATNAGIQTQACDIGIDETVGGSIVAVNPRMDLVVTVAGESPNLVFLGWSFAESIDIKEGGITYDSLMVNMGGFGSDIDFDIGAFFQDLFATNLGENVLSSALETLQNTLGDGLSFS